MYITDLFKFIDPDDNRQSGLIVEEIVNSNWIDLSNYHNRNAFNKLLKGEELTIGRSMINNEKQAWMSRWCGRCRPKQINYNFAESLVNFKIVIFNSGNFDSGESHYIISEEAEESLFPKKYEV